MTRIGYDSVTASNIPTDAQVVMGYVDGLYRWSDADWARFPNSVKARIAVHPSTNDGHVLDVEYGDATPDQAPGWVQVRRGFGIDPTVYCSEAVWGQVRAAFQHANVPEPHYWIAGYPGSVGQALYPGSIAHQFIDDGPYDRSVVADYWPGVDSGPGPTPAPAPTPHKEDDMLLVIQDTAPPKCTLFVANGSAEVTPAQAYLLALAGVPHLDKVPPLQAVGFAQGFDPVGFDRVFGKK